MAKQLNRRNLLVIASVSILVGTEVLGAALAAGWAIGGLLQLSRDLTWGLTAISMACGLWATFKFVQHALKIEPVYT